MSAAESSKDRNVKFCMTSKRAGESWKPKRESEPSEGLGG